MKNGNGYRFTTTTATRSNILLRAGICGAGGSGKTYSALAIMCALAERLGIGPVYAIDSEHNSLLRYAYSPRSGKGFKFEHTPMPTGDYSPDAYMAAIDHVIAKGARVVLIDSISHEWDGANGCLEQVDRIAAAAEQRGRKPDNFSAWREVTPMHRAFLEHLLSMPAHVMFTLRAKTRYEQKKENGKTKFEKTGDGPVQREGIEYEPDLFFWMADAVLTVDKTRCDRIAPGSVHERPGAEFAALLADWIEDCDPTPAAIPAPQASAPATAHEWAAPIYAAAKLPEAVGIAAEIAINAHRAGDVSRSGACIGIIMAIARSKGLKEAVVSGAVEDCRKRIEAGVAALAVQTVSCGVSTARFDEALARAEGEATREGVQA